MMEVLIFYSHISSEHDKSDSLSRRSLTSVETVFILFVFYFETETSHSHNKRSPIGFTHIRQLIQFLFSLHYAQTLQIIGIHAG